MNLLDNASFSIASYSVHSEILEKMVGNGCVENLCVDAGGLRAPKREGASKEILRNLRIPSKTLHAKILLKEVLGEDPEIWLWTGSLRKATFETQNILTAFPLKDDSKKSNLKILKKWFKNPEYNLIFQSDGVSITEIRSQSTETLWKSLKESLERTTRGMFKNFYGISPWGSSEFVREIRKEFFSSIHLYSRNEANNRQMWLDCADKLNEHIFIAHENGAFPHLKCMFVTDDRNRLVWSCICSANFTKAALFNKQNSNVEYALLFEGAYSNKKIVTLFDFLINDYIDSKNKKWQKRKVEYDRCKISDMDDSVESLNEECGDFDNFKRRELCRKILPYLMKPEIQEMLDSYIEVKTWFSKKFGGNEYWIRVVSADDITFHLLIREKQYEEYDIDVPRILDNNPPVSKSEVDLLIETLTSFNADGETSKIRRKEFADENNDLIIEKSFVNVRFLAKRFIDEKGNINKDEVEFAYTCLQKLENVDLQDEQKKFYSIWMPIIKKLRNSV